MKAIIIIDAQNDFIDGALNNPDAQDAILTLKEVVEWGAAKNYALIYTQDTHYKENYEKTQEGKYLPVPHCIKETSGWMITPEVLPDDDNYEICVVEKNQFGYDGWTDADLSAYDEIIIVGFVTDICVISNALILKAFNPEIPMTVISSACAGTTPIKHEAALDVLRSCQFNVTTWEDYEERLL